MIQIDFKILAYWKRQTEIPQISVNEVDIAEFVIHRNAEKSYFQGGFCITVNGIAWNAYEHQQELVFHLDHIAGARDFWFNVKWLNLEQAQSRKIWQCDYSDMEICRNGNSVTLQDPAYELDLIEMDWNSFYEAFIGAGNSFIHFLENSLNYCNLPENKGKFTLAEKSIAEDLERWAVDIFH